MVATIFLGLVFMAGQAHEYLELFESGISVNSSLFASTFFTLTGFHGLHVTLGLVALGILAALAFAGDFAWKAGPSASRPSASTGTSSTWSGCSSSASST